MDGMDKNKTFLIVGLGLLGGKYAQVLSQKGYRVTGITHSQKKSLDDFGDYADTLRKLNVKLSLGEHYTDGFAGQDIIMRTPGYEFFKPEQQAAKQGAKPCREPLFCLFTAGSSTPFR